jgi:hypothetical protein
MKIESNILEISKTMFTNKEHWKFVTDEQKEQFFFIFNRYFSKRYPELGQLLNDKQIDKSIGMDLWFDFMKDKPYPQWFWSKSKKATQSDGDQSLIEELRKSNNLTNQEMDFILLNYSDEVKEEINYLKQIKNGNTNKKLVHNKSSK